MPESNLKQATVLPSGSAIPNPRGTAPGWWIEKHDTIFVAMPGPPSEMTGMWTNSVAPRLESLTQGTVIISRTLKTVGIGEGLVDQMMAPFLQNKNPTIGIYAKSDGVHLRLTAKAKTVSIAHKMIKPTENEVRQILGNAVWGSDDDTLAEVVGSLLKENELSIAVMESCTGGLLASALTGVTGSSEYFKGGLVAYTANSKQRYGVPEKTIFEHGLVSEPTALAMASAVRNELSSDIGIGITGVAGPSTHGGKPVGTTHIGIETPKMATHVTYILPQSRDAIRTRAVTTALMLIRHASIGELQNVEKNGRLNPLISKSDTYASIEK